jgi:hypothetical protein
MSSVPSPRQKTPQRYTVGCAAARGLRPVTSGQILPDCELRMAEVSPPVRIREMSFASGQLTVKH